MGRARTRSKRGKVDVWLTRGDPGHYRKETGIHCESGYSTGTDGRQTKGSFGC